jgi:Domain of Unknown Function (DUF1543)
MAKLYMLLLGCSPINRNIEQHDVFFGIGESVKDLIPDIIAFWPDPKGKLHVDAFREVTRVGGYSIEVVDKPVTNNTTRLFFINLGGYKQNEFEEFHYKMLLVAPDKGDAVRQSKETAFFRHTGVKSMKGANSHIDDKFGVDVDDIFAISDILPDYIKRKYSLLIQPASRDQKEDKIYLGYFKLDAVDRWEVE